MYVESRDTWRFVAPGATQALTAVADLGVTFPVFVPTQVLRIGLLLTVSINSTVNPVINFDKRPTFGSNAGRITGGIGTVTIPFATAIAAPSVVYKDIIPIIVTPAQEIVVTVTTAATVAGSGIPFMDNIPQPDILANSPLTAFASL